MNDMKLTKLVNSENTTSSGKIASPVKAMEAVVKALNLKNGKLTIYVRQGKPSPRVEIQSCLSQELEE